MILWIAVHSVADQQQNDSDGDGETAETAQDNGASDGDTTSQSGSGSSENGGQHPLTAFGGRRGAHRGLDALAEIDEGIADHVAKRLTERVKEVTDDPDE